MKDDLKALTGERDQMNKRLLDYEADTLFSAGKTQKEIYLIKSVFDDRNQKEVKLLAKKILEKYPDIVILFGIKAAGKAQLLFQCSEELTFDMGRLMENACAVINGRGGGRPQQAQGGGPDVEKLEDALQGAEDMLFKIINSV
jgi:alanyl-tRNA synthetase